MIEDLKKLIGKKDFLTAYNKVFNALESDSENTEFEAFKSNLNGNENNKLKAERITLNIYASNKYNSIENWFLGKKYAYVFIREKAKKFFLKSIELDTTNANPYSSMGNLLLLEKKFDEAKEYIDKAIQLNPRHKGAYNNLASYYEILEKEDKAGEVYKKIVQIDPNDFMAIFNLAESMNNQGKFEEARDYFLQALKIEPDDDETYYNLGFVYRDLKMSRESILNFKKAFEIKPSSNYACFLAGALLKEGENEEALFYANKSVQLKFYYSEGYLVKGLIRKNLGEKDKAMESLTDSVKQCSYNPFTFVTRAQLFLENNEPKKAREDLIKAYKYYKKKTWDNNTLFIDDDNKEFVLKTLEENHALIGFTEEEVSKKDWIEKGPEEPESKIEIKYFDDNKNKSKVKDVIMHLFHEEMRDMNYSNCEFSNTKFIERTLKTILDKMEILDTLTVGDTAINDDYSDY